jgi:hypothetical protein
MDEKSDKSWTVVCLRANLKENGGRRGGRKQNLLDLAILYFDGVFGDFGDFESDLGANSTAVTITEYRNDTVMTLDCRVFPMSYSYM